MEHVSKSLVRQTLARYLNCPVECIEGAQRLRGDLDLLPLDIVLVANHLEDVLLMRFAPEDLSALETVGQLEALVCARTESTGVDPMRYEVGFDEGSGLIGRGERISA